jgi:hypothetical protein
MDMGRSCVHAARLQQNPKLIDVGWVPARGRDAIRPGAADRLVLPDDIALEHDAKKWEPVFRLNHAKTKTLIT